MGLDIWKNPANVLLVSSIPFFAGAYLGFKKPTEKLEELVGTAGDGNNKNGGGDGVPTPERRRLGLRMASRALRLATMGTVGGFGILGACKQTKVQALPKKFRVVITRMMFLFYNV